MIFRKLAIISMLVLALIGAVPAAVAGSGSGNIKAGHPGTLVRGVTEAEFREVGKCLSFPPTTQGVDGWVIDLQGGTNLNVTSTSALPHTIVLLFYTQSCLRVGPLYGGMGTTSFNKQIDTHNGTSARWAVVNAVYGANIAVNFTVS